jgi:hypothetical protein
MVMRTLITTRLTLTILFGVSLATLAVACSSSDSATPTVEPPSPEVALENARAAMADVPQFEFELTHPEGTTTLEGGVELRRAEGKVIAPERLSVEAEANLGRLFVRIEAVVIEGQTWMTNVLTGNWSTVAPEDSPFSFLDPVQLVTNVLVLTTDPVYPNDMPGDRNEIILIGKVPSEALQPLVGTVIPDAVLDVRLTLDAESFLLTEARLTGRLQADDEDSFVRLIRISGFEAELVIEPPI